MPPRWWIFTDGVFFIDLALIRDPSLVLPTIAKALNMHEQSGQPVSELLVQELRGQHLLLLIDNFEHLLPSAPQLMPLLLAVPGLAMLITSRTILHLSGEYAFVVPPLDLPPAGDLRHSDAERLESLGGYSAIAMFVACAQSTVPSFALTVTNAALVAAICMRLDGLPLAIGAGGGARSMFALPALLARLEQRLETLMHGAQNMPERHQALRDNQLEL